MIYKDNKKKSGLILINVLVFSTIAVLILSALIGWAASVLKTFRVLSTREQAIAMAEAGIDYYRWHLAHAPTDYKDGTTNNGPYIHQFTDKDGNIIGQYSLTITPPPVGSTIVKVTSAGTANGTPSATRVIRATLAIPSLAKYAVVSNSYLRFGVGTEVFGPIHSNGGIRFDGVAHNVITSAKDKFVDSTNGSSYQFGVYTTVSPDDPHPPSAVPNRSDVFIAGRQFPMPTVDFNGITTDLSTMKSDAQTSGRYFASSGSQGYHIVLKTNDTFDLYKVTSLKSLSSSCQSNTTSQGQSGWGSWSIQNQTFLQNYAFPANGIVFVEDNVWVDGQINTARLTIASGRFPDNPSTRTSITINTDLLYTNFDGKDVIALVAQNNINVGYQSDDDLIVDAALVAQNGRAGRYYYASACGTNYQRSTLSLYGSIMTNLQYGFAYTDGTGYDTRNITYDGNLLYGPPPSFPLTTDQYSTILWQEIKN